MKKFGVIGLGMNCVDCILRVSSNVDLTREPEILDWSIQGGGKVASAMVAVARLGAKTAVITKVGDDEAGRFVISDFQKYGVDTDHILVDEGAWTLTTFILVDEKTGTPRWVRSDVIRDWNLPEAIRRAVEWADISEEERTIIPLGGPFRPYLTEELEFVTEGKVLNLDSILPDGVLEAAEIARTDGIPTCLDMYRFPDMAKLLQKISWCIPSQKSAEEFTKETDPKAMCRSILKYGPEIAGVTLGEQGTIFMSRNKTVIRKAFKVPVIDTTGAGDVFHGAFSFGMLQRWDLAKTVEFSSAVSAIKCTKLGGRAGIPTLPQVQAFLKEHVHEIRC